MCMLACFFFFSPGLGKDVKVFSFSLKICSSVLMVKVKVLKIRNKGETNDCPLTAGHFTGV